MGNNKACKDQGIGFVRIKLQDGIEQHVNQVRYISELKRNSLSLGMFEMQGYSFKAKNGILHVYNDDTLILKGIRKIGLYVLSGCTVVGYVSTITASLDKIVLWNKRIGHVSQRGLNELGKQNLLFGDKITKLDLCELCIFDKAKKGLF